LAEEFVIKSETLEDKINQLLPSQGGFGAGVDLSASSMIIPIVDLTESAEGSNLRVDLQTALSFTNATTFNVNGTTSTIINTTGYWRLVAGYTCFEGSGTEDSNILIEDTSGATKILWGSGFEGSLTPKIVAYSVDFVFFLKAGDSLQVSCGGDSRIRGSVRQIADVTGNLVNPL